MIPKGNSLCSQDLRFNDWFNGQQAAALKTTIRLHPGSFTVKIVHNPKRKGKLLKGESCHTRLAQLAHHTSLPYMQFLSAQTGQAFKTLPKVGQSDGTISISLRKKKSQRQQ